MTDPNQPTNERPLPRLTANSTDTTDQQSEAPQVKHRRSLRMQQPTSLRSECSVYPAHNVNLDGPRPRALLRRKRASLPSWAVERPQIGFMLDQGFGRYAEKLRNHYITSYDWSFQKGWPILVLFVLPFFFGEVAHARLVDVNAAQSAAQLSSKNMAAAYDLLWIEDFPTYINVVSRLTAFVGVISLLRTFWKMYNKGSENGGMALGQLVPPLMLITFLSAPGGLAVPLSAMKDAIVDFNETALQAIALGDAYAEAEALSSYPAVLSPQTKQCEQFPPGEQQIDCMNVVAGIGKQLIAADRKKFGDKKWIDDKEKSINQLASGETNVKNPGLLDTGAGFLKGFGEFLWSFAEEIVMLWMQALSYGFQNLFQIALILTSLLAPIAMYMSMSDLGMMPIYAFVTGITGIGQIIFWFNITGGIAASAFVKSSGILQLAFSMFLGLFSPFLALALSAAGGFAIWSMLLQGLSLGAGVAAGGSAPNSESGGSRGRRGRESRDRGSRGRRGRESRM